MKPKNLIILYFFSGNSSTDSDDDYSPVCSENEDNDVTETEEIKKVLIDEIEKIPEDSDTPKGTDSHLFNTKYK